MKKTLVFALCSITIAGWVMAPAAFGQCSGTQCGAGVAPCPVVGPDVIVGDCADMVSYGRVGDIHAFDIGTVSCNIGNQNVQWQANNNLHPVIGQNVYRLKNGRFEQVGQSWLKHGFTALTQNLCCTCNGSGGTVLGQGCSDPYTGGLNGSQSRLGERSTVNAATGVYTYPYTIAFQVTGNAIYKRLQIHDVDLDPSLNSGARYFAEAQYVTQDDATAGNKNNNASYRECRFTGSGSPVTYSASFVSGANTQRQKPAIQAWRDVDPAVTLVAVDVPSDGRIWVGYKITSLGGGMYHYEYAIENLTSDRSVGAFSIPVPANIGATRIGFHDVDYHSGEPYANTDWSATLGGGNLAWNSPQTYAQNPNTNALRWGTTYNFRFDSNSSPGAGTGTLTLFKPGAPTSMAVAVAVPSGTPDCNTNGVPDATDVSNGAADCNTDQIPDICEAAGNDCNSNGMPDECEPFGADCNTNTVADMCELGGNDCNTNSNLDTCEIAGHDCNTNNILDACDAAVAGRDCDHNGIPDVCQPDCNTNGTIDACDNLADCNTNGSPDICDVSGVLGGTRNYASGAVNMPIFDPPGAATVSTQTVPASAGGQITDINVAISLTHTYLGDLGITLSHGTTTVSVWNHVCNGNDNMTVTFDDAAPVIVCNTPTSGTYRPSAALSAFNGVGTNAAGNWTLTIVDNAGQDTGVLQNWTLIVTTLNSPPRSPDLNSNGIPDECECATCAGDLSGDGAVDGTDINPFVGAFLGAYSPCADMNASGTLTETDLQMFVTKLLTTAGPCP